MTLEVCACLVYGGTIVLLFDLWFVFCELFLSYFNLLVFSIIIFIVESPCRSKRSLHNMEASLPFFRIALCPPW